MLERLRFRSRLSGYNDSTVVPNNNDASRHRRHQRLPDHLDHHRKRFPRHGLPFLALILFIVATIHNPVIISKPVTDAPEANEDNRVPWRTDQLSHCPDSKVQTIFNITYTLPSNTTIVSTSSSQKHNDPKVLRKPPNVLINTKTALDDEPEYNQKNVMRK